MAQNELVCISFGTEKLRLAHAKGALPRNEIMHLAIRDIRNLSDPDISQLIRTTIAEMKIKVRRAILSIPSRLVITKNIEIPSRNSKEIQEIINLQSGRYTPYSREEIIVDYINIGVYRQNYTKALLVIVPQVVVKRYAAIVTSAGLEIEKVTIVSEGIAAAYPYLARFKAEDSPVSVVHVNDECTDFAVVYKDKMIYARNISLGVSSWLADKEKFKEKFVEEIKRSLESYQSEDIEKTPGNIIFTGAIAELAEIKPLLDNNLYIPAAFIPYAEHLPLKKPASDAISAAKDCSFLDVVTPLLFGGGLSIDLTPKEIKLRKALEERGKDIIQMGVLLLATFALICGILMSKIFVKTVYLTNLKTKYQQANKDAERLAQSFSRIETIKKYLSLRGYSLEILNELHELILPDIYLTNAKFDEKGEFQIKGSSVSMSTVFTLVSTMEKSRYFQNVKTRYTTKRKEGELDLTDFHIVCSLEGPVIVKQQQRPEEQKEEQTQEQTQEQTEEQ